MITSMHIENFKCFKDFNIELGPFNVLIGPNDSGKTSCLDSIRLVSDLGLEVSGKAGVTPQKLGVRLDARARYLGASEQDKICIRVRHRPTGSDAESILTASASSDPRGNPRLKWELVLGPRGSVVPMGTIASFRFDPQRLRTAAPLSADMATNGEGLPGFIARMALKRDGTMDALENEFRDRFPFYSAIVTDPSAKGGNAAHLRFRTRRGGELPCSSVSDGVMLSLAFLAVRHSAQPPDILLIEEPENGVHHASLKDIIGTLKQLSQEKGVQVILTTHSPYLLDEVEMNEVHVFEKDEEGAVHTKLLSEFEGAKEIGGMFSTGEKWSMLSEKFGI